MLILGIETSCDETSAAIIKATKNSKKVTLLSNVISSSLPMHSETGGIIPETAAREQVKFTIPVIKKALTDANLELKDIDKIAVTYGPGLIGSLLIGVESVKAISFAYDIPLIPVNHLIGHIYANWISSHPELVSGSKPQQKKIADQVRNDKSIDFPAIGLIVSGGHTDLVLIKQHGSIEWLGGTRDDAAGECFDKCARLLGFPYPGGPKIAELAKKGNPKAFQFPRPMIGSRDFEFSFSGLKAAFLRETQLHFPILRTSNAQISWEQITKDKAFSESQEQKLNDLCASLEEAIVSVLVSKTMKAAKKYKVKSILVGGGVAANQKLRERLQSSIDKDQSLIKLFVPPRNLCTDNGAMIASAAFFTGKQISWQKVNADPSLYF